jgi:hypothetical protein
MGLLEIGSKRNRLFARICARLPSHRRLFVSGSLSRSNDSIDSMIIGTTRHFDQEE